MAGSSMHTGDITLHGVHDTEDGKPGSAPGVLLKLSDGLLQDIKRASHAKEGLQFVTGSAPKLRIGGRTIDMNLSAEAFRTELYASTAAGSLTDLTLSGVVSHRAELRQLERRSGEDTAGSEAALAALQSSLASYEQDKQAKQSNIVNSVLPTAKSRFVTGKQKRSLLGPQQHATSSPGSSLTPQHGSTLPSASNSDAAVRLQALKIPIIHLLALKPASGESITSKTHIPKGDLENILQKIAKQEDGKWKLGDRAYRELDAWKFGYTSKGDRQLAIDNAIRAYDRLRVGKEEKIWQLLLPKEDRGKGIILSRLQTGGGQVDRGLTPNYAPSPLPHVEGVNESKPVSAATTPRVGASTPKPATAKSDVLKRLLAKDPKKARAMEEAKEKKRKERDAAREVAASDREGAKPAKRQTAKPSNPKVKSAPTVHSSDDESGEEGEVKDEITRVDSKTSPEKSKPAVKSKASLVPSQSPDGGDALVKSKTPSDKATTKHKAAADPAKSIASLANKVSTPTGAGKSTPRNNTNLAAPTSQHKSQRSPQKPDSKPNVPSPLGAARPRVASDVSDRNAVGIQRARQGAGTPQSLGVTNGLRKRQDTVTSIESTALSSSDKKRTENVSSQKPHKVAANGTSTPKIPPANGAAHKAETGVKRKAEDMPAQEDERAPVAKHRKTDSTSSQSQNSHASSMAATQSTARTSPDAALDSGSSDSAGSVLDTITYAQGLNMAEKFRDVYYPAYAQMYDGQVAKEAKGETVTKDERERLWAMHRRLEQMKREIQIASEREHRED
ncbi:hypothetical protein LTR36_004679 [Oleoguttula mirabilis]|uniref:E3 ubiquitin-protein ligase n=1 Tax=Oleoguttula mirabilis TaxID=1507867 RepID=A0AAV9JHC5_9PEZI|nr:hypothetical protein LTR36_004679 [Oleoguttula mirabilis]